MPSFLKEAQGSVPTEFQLFPAGQVLVEGAGSAIVDGQAMEQVISAFKKRGNDIVIDYEHQTLSGDKAPAAGWITSIVNRGKAGLWAFVDWTEAALKHLQRGEYRYFSPVFIVNKKDHRVNKVHSVALTNSPRINHLKPIVAKLAEATDNLSLRSETEHLTANFKPLGESVYHQVYCSDPDLGPPPSFEEAEEINRLMNVTWDEISLYGFK